MYHRLVEAGLTPHCFGGRAMEVRGEYTLAIPLKEKNWDFLGWMSVLGYDDLSRPPAIKEFGNEEMVRR